MSFRTIFKLVVDYIDLVIYKILYIKFLIKGHTN